MSTRDITANCGLSLMGFDFWATIEFKYTPGRKETWCKRIGTWDPPEPPEIEINAITLQLDEPGKLGPAWALDGEMLNVIADHEAVINACWESDHV